RRRCESGLSPADTLPRRSRRARDRGSARAHRGIAGKMMMKMAMRTLLAAFLLLGCGAASGDAAQDEAEPANLSAAGRYRDNAGPDVASELELGRDGRFRFFI